MRETGKLDYLEMPATGGTIDSVKAFYSAAFGWTFTDYGPSYSAFEEGLDGGFHTDPAEVVEAVADPLFWRSGGDARRGGSRGRQDRQADLFLSRRAALSFPGPGRKRTRGVERKTRVIAVDNDGFARLCFSRTLL